NQVKMKNLVGYCGIIFTCLLICTEQSKIKALSPQASSGVYVIHPPGAETPFKVHCEMQKDEGWTVFQRRSGEAVRFDRNWDEYKNGFGSLKEDHWLGLKKVFSLTKNKAKEWILRIDLWDYEGGTAFAEYRNFRIDNEEKAFKLHVGNYSGNAGDAIHGDQPGMDQNGYGFSTIDHDNDGCSPCITPDIALNECSSSEDAAAWWYSRCGSASLNGQWHPVGDNIGWVSGLHWGTWKPSYMSYSAKASRMMIKSV
uniref:Fibrinogen C-terminal domain-containing protein n=1 Tax=Monopterus albus TaxID=43700 RepID=A0A3Q3QNM8_MONAL